MQKDDLAVAMPTPNARAPEPPPLLRHVRSYPGREDQLSQVRAFVWDVLAGLPRAGDAVMLASAFSANACLHSRSGIPGGVFTVRAEAREGGYLSIAVEDEGGPWNPQAREAPSRHGLDVVEGIAGAANWGITGDAGGRLAWARLLWSRHASATMPAPCADDDVVTDLDKLAITLAAYGLEAELIIPAGGGDLPHLAVQVATIPLLTCRVYAQADWFFWPHAERIAACDDVLAAANAIARYVGDDAGAPDA